MKYTLRRMFSVVTIGCITLGIFLKPIRYLIDNLKVDEYSVNCFLLPIYDLLWMLGINQAKFNDLGPASSTNGILFFIGVVVSAVLHGLIVVTIGQLIANIWDWGN